MPKNDKLDIRKYISINTISELTKQDNIKNLNLKTVQYLIKEAEKYTLLLLHLILESLLKLY